MANDNPKVVKLMDERHELTIKLAGKDMEIRMAMADLMPEGARRNLMRAEAQAHLRTMERLIKERIAIHAARAEQAKGLQSA